MIKTQSDTFNRLLFTQTHSFIGDPFSQDSQWL